PYSVGQVPVYYNELSTGRHYEPGDDNKFLSKYIDMPNAPLYPFGFGLTYSDFEISGIRLDKNELRQGAGESIKAEVTLKNTGAVEASEVVQLYIRDEYASVTRPVRELKGFKKIKLAPGGEERVTFEIEEEMLKFTGADDVYGSEKGEFTVFIGNSSTTENKASFNLV
ncbi:MAG: fibronectin type III-like domain-contianing protein, partial [Lachnospiraceae bacterium]|nr:fibronectin type III-like domain-contianing protein [Lachnospiraceae bacterium]